MKNNLFVKAIKQDGEVKYPIKAQGTRYKKFIEDIPDGANIEIYDHAGEEKGHPTNPPT